MKNNKQRYTAPSLELLKTESGDIISTSGFNGADHVFGSENLISEASYDVMLAAPIGPYEI